MAQSPPQLSARPFELRLIHRSSCCLHGVPSMTRSRHHKYAMPKGNPNTGNHQPVCAQAPGITYHRWHSRRHPTHNPGASRAPRPMQSTSRQRVSPFASTSSSQSRKG